jgi:predicted DNA-binding protein (UPF0251 family)
MGGLVIRKGRKDRVGDLKAVLSKIAKGRGLRDPDLQAQIVRNKLFRRMEDHCLNIAATRHSEHFVESLEKADQWVCYVIRLAINKRTIGRRRGSALRATLSSAIADAATITNVNQLTPVEQRAFAILKGARRPTKKTKHPIEKRALELAKVVKAEWFTTPPKTGRPKGRWIRKSESYQRKGDQSFDALKPRLTVFDVVLIAVPVIEDFANCKITLQSEEFEALYRVVCAYTDAIRRDTPSRELHISRKTVYQALRRARPELALRKLVDLEE